MSKATVSPITNFFREQSLFSLTLLRLVGYALIAMAMLDYISLLIPPQFMNPVWEFQTMGAVVERLPIVLLGMVFIFCGEREERRAIEHGLLKWFSWLSLVFAIILSLSFPLSIVNGFRIYYGSNARVNAQISPRVDILNEFQTELEAAESLSEISNVLQQQSNNPISLPKTIDTEELKKNILSTINDNQEQLKFKATQIRSQKRLVLLKNGVKWNLGSLISVFLLIFIWQQTTWARMPYELNED